MLRALGTRRELPKRLWTDCGARELRLILSSPSVPATGGHIPRIAEAFPKQENVEREASAAWKSCWRKEIYTVEESSVYKTLLSLSLHFWWGWHYISDSWSVAFVYKGGHYPEPGQAIALPQGMQANTNHEGFSQSDPYVVAGRGQDSRQRPRMASPIRDCCCLLLLVLWSWASCSNAQGLKVENSFKSKLFNDIYKRFSTVVPQCFYNMWYRMSVQGHWPLFPKV